MACLREHNPLHCLNSPRPSLLTDPRDLLAWHIVRQNLHAGWYILALNQCLHRECLNNELNPSPRLDCQSNELNHSPHPEWISIEQNPNPCRDSQKTGPTPDPQVCLEGENAELREDKRKTQTSYTDPITTSCPGRVRPRRCLLVGEHGRGETSPVQGSVRHQP
ncbi:uncharacterized protein LOC124286658 isoform X1 [Haliotis rubra]|uniref:uncharacterized protein LOC124286658 isoform X1 n=1 Tax=Haliotis rubra TaxID=36100 RepID=UPI001EE53462|nr:uncharacterized protein LOC124286658 isoform X1 [Haliotis rubra]